MILNDILELIIDEEVRIELEIDDGSEDYKYKFFWLSDYRIHHHYSDYTVTSITFDTTNSSDILISIKE